MHKHNSVKKKHHDHHYKHGLKHETCGSHRMRHEHQSRKTKGRVPFGLRLESGLSRYLSEEDMPASSVGLGQSAIIVPRIDSQRCKICGKCQHVCPSSAIRIEHDITSIDEKKCNGCGHCIDACSEGALMF